jgi:hypothetical protein
VGVHACDHRLDSTTLACEAHHHHHHACKTLTKEHIHSRVYEEFIAHEMYRKAGNMGLNAGAWA